LATDLRGSIPTGVTIAAIVFFLAAAYLGFIGAVMLASPGAVSMALGAPRTGDYRPSDDRLVSVSGAGKSSFRKRLATDFTDSHGSAISNKFLSDP
jgi:hypothetical protein